MTRREPRLFGNAYHRATVLVTGHTGFKGAWLCEWLSSLGARVIGFGLEPDTHPSLFEQLGLAGRVRHHVGDIRDAAPIAALIAETQPGFVFHLAAQPLVRRSYREARYTWETNVMGTINVLEALRAVTSPCMAVMVTTDKCYENREWVYGYREDDALGGHDPYASSKAAAEVAIAAWRRSFFGGNHVVRIASARAGNVIGGGDWAADRIVPDCIRALRGGRDIVVRNPLATRPWQHVLEPVSGYLALAAALAARPGDRRLESAFNIGPDRDANQTVRRLVETSMLFWSGTWRCETETETLHEASLLHLDNAKIRSLVGWKPVWTFQQAVEHTIRWYREYDGADTASKAHDLTARDIASYEQAAVGLGADWAVADCQTSTMAHG